MNDVPDVEFDDLRDAADVTDDEHLHALAAMIAGGAELAWVAALGGSSFSPNGRRRFDWMHGPRIGDFVHVGIANGSPIDMVGEWIGAWSYLGSDYFVDHPDNVGCGDVVYYIATIDGRGMKWGNCELHRIPRDPAEARTADRELVAQS